MSTQTLSFKSAGWLPVSLAAMLGTGMIVAYIWAVARKDVPSHLPFISSAGGNPPQSGVFAIFLFFSATIGILTVVVRHVGLNQEASGLGLKHSQRLNHFGLFLGLLCVTGMILVAAYPVHTWKLLQANQTETQEDVDQWRKSVLLPHTLGASLCFAVGIAYAICQSFLSLFIRPACGLSNWKVKHVFLFAARIATCLVAFVALFLMHFLKKDQDDLWQDTPRSKTRALFEWILALMLILLFLSLYPEMKSIEMELRLQAQPCGRTDSASDVPMAFAI